MKSISPIPSWPGYYATPDGRIISDKPERRRRDLKQTTNFHGYKQVTLSYKGKTKTQKSHRLIASAFIPNPRKKPAINHKNGDKTDNRVCNLEWVTYSENSKHSIRVLGNPKPPTMLGRRGEKCPFSKKVKQFRLDGSFIKTFPAAHEASRQTGINRANICNACRGLVKTAGGYKWAYV